jgi:hypothetical protein
MVRKKFDGQGNSVYEKGAEAIATGKTLDLLSSFFLCITMQWLFCEVPRSWSAGGTIEAIHKNVPIGCHVQ